jgi:hypothetical protein
MSNGRFVKGHTPWNKGLPNSTSQCKWWKNTKLKKKVIKKISESTIKFYNKTPIDKRPQWKGGHETWKSMQAKRTLEKHYNMKWIDMHLPENPIIHHIDRNRENNSFENLCVMNRAEHTSLHWEQGDIR